VLKVTGPADEATGPADEATGPADAEAVTVRFWAGARRAAGHAEQRSRASTVGTLRAELAKRPELRDIIAVAAVLVNSTAAGDETPLRRGAVVDILPPFAGGANWTEGSITY
jgi:molybdopterin synthase sulfur carrier subunit